MKPLSDLQREFCDALRAPGPPSPELMDELLDDGTALERFNVYRNNFIVLNGDALADMYPTTRRLVGCEAFRSLANLYVRTHPPESRTLLLYGDRFPGFLESIPELSRLPYLSDVARLEFAWTRAYHAPDARILGRDEVASITAQAFTRIGLEPHPSMHCISSDYPVYRIWAANQEEGSEETISLDSGLFHILIIRPGMDVETREVGEGAFLFLQRLQAGDSIEDAFNMALQTDSAFDLAGFFAHHLFDGTFCALRKPRT